MVESRVFLKYQFQRIFSFSPKVQYLMLLDYTSRLVRDGKAAVSAEVESIFTRLGSSAESWGARLLKMSGTRLLGRFVAASRGRLREIAQRIGVRHLANAAC